jgi:hypothetical protein
LVILQKDPYCLFFYVLVPTNLQKHP